jgi:hypothetical protein
MKSPVISGLCFKPVKDRFLEKILRRGGAYFHSADLFYHELWRQQLIHPGFRVVWVERLAYR